MSELREFKLPDVGEGLTEADIVSWHVKPGDQVKVNQVIVEIETAKSVVELPCPWEGTIASLLVDEGQTVDVGIPIITVDIAGTAGASTAHAGSSQAGTAQAGTAGPGPAGAGTGGTGTGGAGTASGSGTPAAGGTERTAVLVGYGVRTASTTRRPRKGQGHSATPATPVTPATPKTSNGDISEISRFSGVGSAGTGVVRAAGTGGAAGTGAVGAAGTGASGTTGTEAGRTGSGTVGAAGTGAGSAAGTGAAVPAGTGAGGTAGAGAAAKALAKPPVRKLAKDLGISLAELTGTGPQGSITRDDVHRAVAAQTARYAENAVTGAARAAGPATTPGLGQDERIPIRGVRKHMAAAMVSSAFTAPHVSEFLQVDVTDTMAATRRIRDLGEYAGVRVSPLLFVARALLVAVGRYPLINSVWDEAAQEIVIKRQVNLGIAVASDRGLIVPNVKNAGALPLPDLARALQALAETARAGKATPADLAGGTITITNVGVFGIDAGTPIINPGEAAILAFGQVRDTPWVVDGQIAVRKVCTLSLSFDHRIVDGELGSAVLRDVGSMLHDPLTMLAWS